VLVSEILDHSDAARRGVRYDDEIVSFAGRPIRSVNGFKNVLGIFPKGWRVALSYRRDGKTYDTFVRLAGVHTESELLAKIDTDKEIAPPQPKPAPRRPGDQKKPDEQPKPGDQGKPGDQPKPLPKPDSDLEEAIRTPVPEALKKQYEERTGYANFYFNRENVQRIWKELVARGDFSKVGGHWTITGQPVAAGQPMPVQPAAGDKITVHLADEQSDIDLPTGPSKISVADGLDAVLNPPGSGGLLAALHLWRKLLVGGPGKFGQVTYEGTCPLPGHVGLFDVLTGIGEGVETHFYCDPANGTLVCVEMFPDDEADPCEVYFSDYREEAGRFLPHRMEVRHGDDVFGVFVLSGFDLQPAAAK
jgi:hypothetical protein